MLYIPIDWWHWVFSSGDPVIAMSFWSPNPHYSLDSPTLMTAGCAHWPATSTWNLDSFGSLRNEEFDRSLMVCKNASHSFYPEESFNNVVTSIKAFSSFKDQWQKQDDSGFCFASVEVAHDSELFKDVQQPSSFAIEREENIHRHLWVY